MEELAILDKLLNQDYDRRATPTNHLSNLLKKHLWFTNPLKLQLFIVFS